MLGDEFIGVFELHNDTRIKRWFYRPYGSVIEHIEFNLVTEGKTQTSLTGFKSSNQNAVNYHYGDSFELKPGQTGFQPYL